MGIGQFIMCPFVRIVTTCYDRLQASHFALNFIKNVDVLKSPQNQNLPLNSLKTVYKT